jgi:aryl-alcohol dehydrogenase-like predicted oxidoreductase
MEYRTLGRTDFRVSVASLGTGGPSVFGQATGLTEAASHRLLRRAFDLGINLIDTAAGYRESEALLGRGLQGIPRHRYFLATKWSPLEGEEPKTDPAELVGSVERSLERLQTDVIDLMQLHGVVPGAYRQVADTFYPALVRLREQGKIRWIGITERFFHDPEHRMLPVALADDCWDTIMLKYGILNMAAARAVLPLAQERNVGVLNMASVRVKLTRPEELSALIADWKRRGLVGRAALPDADPLGWLVRNEVDSVVAAGYKFALDHPAVSTVLTGTADPAHLEANVAAILGPPLPGPDRARLEAVFGPLTEAA